MGHWADDAAGSTPQRPRPVEAVHRFESALSAIERAQMEEQTAVALPWWQWRIRRVGVVRARAATDQACNEKASALRQFGPNGVGGLPGVWGVLSGAPMFHLEKTLRDLCRPNRVGSDVRSLSERLLEMLPDARLSAHLGDRQGEDQVASMVLEMAQITEGPRDRRHLFEHLPASMRPLPASVQELERSGNSGSPVTLFVSEDLATRAWWRTDTDVERRAIRLSDVIVTNGLNGLGLGTAALQELCRYADATGSTIHGQMMPGPGFKDYETRIPRLANWYYRHGFESSSGLPERWSNGAIIVREPVPR